MERLCSWPSWISARVRSHSRKGPERPVVPPDQGRDGETVSPSPQSNSQTSAGTPSFCQLLRISQSHLRSEPRPLARLRLRAAAHAASDVTRVSYPRPCTNTVKAIRASLLARAVARTL